MSLIKLVDGREIDTTNKTVVEVIKEALADIPMTMENVIKFEKILREEMSKLKENIYADKCNEFEKTLSPEQQSKFYKIERLQELKGINNELWR